MLSLSQRLSQQQKLSPQQIQYQKLLQLNTLALEQRIKTELEINPILEENDDGDSEVQEQEKDSSDEVADEYSDHDKEEFELEDFMNKGHVNFPDEVVRGRALTKIFNTPYPAEEKIFLEKIDVPKIRKIIDNSENGYLEPSAIQHLLSAAHIPLVKEAVAITMREIISLADKMGYPIALKVVGPVHKSDVGGVTLNIKSQKHLEAEFTRMKKIKGVTGVMVQEMLSGTELFIGAKYEPRFGHIILCGLGGIFVEVLGDVSSGLAPLTFNEADS